MCLIPWFGTLVKGMGATTIEALGGGLAPDFPLPEGEALKMLFDPLLFKAVHLLTVRSLV